MCGGHVREPELHGLELGDLPSELLPLEGVRARRVERRLGDPDRLRGDADPAAVERRHRHREALPFLVQKPVGVDVGAVEPQVGRRGRVDPELLLLPRDLDVLRVEDERRDTACALGRGVGASEEQEGRGVAAVRAPLLRAGEPPAVAVGHGRRPERPRVGARARLGERERADRLAAGERRHEAGLLLVRPEGHDREGRRARVDGHGHADTRVGARELLEHEHVRDEVGPGAAELLGDAHAHQPDLSEGREELAREAVLPVPVGRVRPDLGIGDVARERLDLALLRGQGEVHDLSLRAMAQRACAAAQRPCEAVRRREPPQPSD